MNKEYWVILLSVLMLVFIGSVYSKTSIPEIVEKDGVLWAGDGWSMETNGVRVAYFTGSPEDIGIQHGLLLADDDELREYSKGNILTDLERVGDTLGILNNNNLKKTQLPL